MARAPFPTFLFLLGLLTVAGLGTGAFRLFSAPSPRALIEEAREELRLLRSAADACQAELNQEEVGFREYDEEVGALRGRIRTLESLHPDGVPADSYVVYLELVNRFNLAVPGWSLRADSLQAAWELCREQVEAHNTLADSVLRMLEAEGIQPVTRIPSSSSGPRILQPEWDPPR